MLTRVVRGVLAALLVAALIAVPVFAIRGSNPAADQSSMQAGDTDYGAGTSDTDDRDEERKGPPWATDGDQPPFGNAWGHGRANANSKAEPNDDGRNGSTWLRHGNGPPYGNAWGYWLNKGGGDACERMAARMRAHSQKGPPAHVRDRIGTELGCDLPK